jgi:hypothetical protein
MKLPNNDNSSVAPPIGARRCPVCGLPIFLAKIEPSDKLGHDQHTFWCTECSYAETVIVQFGHSTNRGMITN